MRKSLYVIVKIYTQKEVNVDIKHIKRRVGGNFNDVFKTNTADNEFLDQKSIKQASGCREVYYAHPIQQLGEW